MQPLGMYWVQLIKSYQRKMLSPVLPYEVVAVVRDYHNLPDTMRHYFHLNV